VPGPSEAFAQPSEIVLGVHAGQRAATGRAAHEPEAGPASLADLASAAAGRQVRAKRDTAADEQRGGSEPSHPAQDPASPHHGDVMHRQHPAMPGWDNQR
jgi:hypothetical protein